MIACIRKVDNPDRYFIRRGRYFYYKRYVPTELQELDNRAPYVRQALKTVEPFIVRSAHVIFWRKRIIITGHRCSLNLIMRLLGIAIKRHVPAPSHWASVTSRALKSLVNHLRLSLNVCVLYERNQSQTYKSLMLSWVTFHRQP